MTGVARGTGRIREQGQITDRHHRARQKVTEIKLTELT